MDTSDLLGAHYEDCARLYLRRFAAKTVNDGDDVIKRCIEEAFEGNKDEFVKWSDSYLAGGCGIAG